MQILDPNRPLWLTELAQAFNSPEALLEFLELDPAQFAPDIEARKLFALRVPRPFAEKMQKNRQTTRFFCKRCLCAKSLQWRTAL